jgi:hemerythrin-like domain-containing protein
VLESLEEHHVVRILTKELAGLPASDEHFAAKANVLMETVRHHVESEERQVFPRMRKSLSRKRVIEIGDAMRKVQRKARKTGPGKAMRKAAKKT